jgi:hypothetical protein
MSIYSMKMKQYDTVFINKTLISQFPTVTIAASRIMKSLSGYLTRQLIGTIKTPFINVL